ncbi:MAG: FAD-dependent oxidoreductase [Streptococcaceae bacterium]|jgi:ferredoxin-NADP reductase|nr:FAD-dependent oxidoreductase [Streptococcaceae bacterium]
MPKFFSLPLVKIEQEQPDIFTFYFEKKENMQLEGGQYGLFAQTKLTNPHPFSIASSPKEAYLSFTTIIRKSSKYKQNLMSMAIGDKLIMIGPLQNFGFVNGVQKYMFIAQGIGITPFRSLLKAKFERSIRGEVTLLHIAKKDHLFKDLTNQLAERSYYPTNSASFKEILSNNLQSEYYYIAGSKEFTKSTKAFLIDKGVPSSQIKFDSFTGY